ncbi:hypothetical protein ACJZ2D_014692 [Fusarium nematophilum]
MCRADLYSIWGNTLLPCFLLGDTNHPPPAVLAPNYKESDTGNYINCFARDAKVSALGHFLATGYPAYRLKVQVRMAKGMFDIISKAIYPYVPLEYAPSCDISLPQFQLGRDLETFARERHPELAGAPAGLAPIFVHCEGSKVSGYQFTSSKRSPDQVKIALHFIAGFVNSKEVVDVSECEALKMLIETELLDELV